MKRLIVHESMFEEVVESLKKKLETVQVGNAEDEKTDIGPLVAERQLMLLESQVSDAVQKGAKIITGGKRSEGLIRIASQIKTGMVSVNNASYLKPCNPFGGVKESGIGREHGKFGFNELTNIKIFAMEK